MWQNKERESLRRIGRLAIEDVKVVEPFDETCDKRLPANPYHIFLGERKAKMVLEGSWSKLNASNTKYDGRLGAYCKDSSKLYSKLLDEDKNRLYRQANQNKSL